MYQNCMRIVPKEGYSILTQAACLPYDYGAEHQRIYRGAITMRNNHGDGSGTIMVRNDGSTINKYKTALAGYS